MKEMAKHPGAVFGDGRCMAESLCGLADQINGGKLRCVHSCHDGGPLCEFHLDGIRYYWNKMCKDRALVDVGRTLLSYLLEEGADRVLLTAQGIAQYKIKLKKYEGELLGVLSRRGWSEEELSNINLR